jgi:hypothetical protein
VLFWFSSWFSFLERLLSVLWSTSLVHDRLWPQIIALFFSFLRWLLWLLIYFLVVEWSHFLMHLCICVRFGEPFSPVVPLLCHRLRRWMIDGDQKTSFYSFIL